ncbi:MAG: DUF3987 domain-containing protein [Lysobacterales bacterium]
MTDALPRNIASIEERADAELERTVRAASRVDQAADPHSKSSSNQTFSKTAPEPLRRPLPPPEPYPLDQLGPILADAAKTLRRVVQAPDAICGASVLAAASLATQGLADVHHHGRVYPLSLWLLTIAESGERKSAVDGEAMRAARDFEKEQASSYQTSHEIHRAQMAEWEAKQQRARDSAKKAGGAGLAHALLDLGPAPKPPLLPKITVADFTAEGIAKLHPGPRSRWGRRGKALWAAYGDTFDGAADHR